MQLENFVAGKWTEQYQHKSFSPNKINHSWLINDEKLCYMLSKADRLIGELNSFSQIIPDVDFFIKMHIFKEATDSSRIEGTQTNIEDAVQKIQYIAPEKRDDWQEVNNYVMAMNTAINELKHLPLCNRLLRETHRILMDNVRGKNKQPGEFRTSQNWIGGATINDAIFIPPHHTSVIELMSDLEQFLQNTEVFIPPLIKIAIAHYQFETIHPFLDGNGRIGRLLITLYLISEGVLSRPTLYLSTFFAKHKPAYYDNLMIARTQNNISQWLCFFLQGVITTAEDSISTLTKIIKLKSNIESEKITELGKKVKLGQKFLNLLWEKPIVDAENVSEMLAISKQTALRLISDFIALGILKETTGYKRNRSFVFEEYMRLFL